MKISLVRDWRDAPKWLSTNFIALEVIWLSAWSHFEAVIERRIGEDMASDIALGIAIAAGIGRMIQVQIDWSHRNDSVAGKD